MGLLLVYKMHERLVLTGANLAEEAEKKARASRPGPPMSISLGMNDDAGWQTLAKNVTEIKPNSSELSYLLYYASTRRSKLQKVGSFLEKKTTSDVYKGRIGNVQVTLQILKALVDKLPRDLPLYARYVLRILSTVLHSKDLTLAEDSTALFETFCQHHDVATLAADQEHVANYEDVVRSYAGFAAQQAAPHSKNGSSAPIELRWKAVALTAIQSITISEALGADGGKQMGIIMPIVLQNLRPDDDGFFWTLQQRLRATETLDRESALKRRVSNATVQTVEDRSRPGSATLSATADDADRLAEEEVGLQAQRSLKQIFVANNRTQIRMATASMIGFICSEPAKRQSSSQKGPSTQQRNWATALVEMVTRWTPVQDRFIILVTIVETLVRSPIVEENLTKQLLLTALVDSLLKSSINMIGLSVMDVLLGLVQHILLLLQLGGKGSNVLPHHQQTDAIDLFQETSGLMSPPSSDNPGVIQEVSSPSSNRQELLDHLQQCIGDLANHIYYSDQVADLITAILLRLKPSSTSSVSTMAAAVEHPQAAAQAIANSVQLQENPKTDEFFSFGTARVTALKAVKEVLLVANLKGQTSGGAAMGRSRVGVSVWEGTQWLLRDEDRRVRRAYVDALLTWLHLELSKSDLRVLEDKRQLLRRPSKIGDSTEWGQLTRRAVSNASHREKQSKPAKSSFLQLLHLAIYDNAIESPESEADLLLLHLLLVSLLEKLGVNAVKEGLPMILRLQEDINIDAIFASPSAKLNIGSLVHGYLWALSEKFDLDGSRVGYEIQTEISRRKRHKLWLDTIQVPAVALASIMTITSTAFTEHLPIPVIQQEALKPFDSRGSLVDQIALSYGESMVSPPVSPPSSPGRVFSLPVLSTSVPAASDSELPSNIKDAMLSEWSKEICIASVEKETTRTISLSGSRTGTNLSARARALGLNGNSTRNGSPTGDQSPTRISPNDGSTPPYQQQGLNFPFRRTSGPEDGSPTPVSSSDHNPTLRVDDLKRVLAGGTLGVTKPNVRGASPLRNSDTVHHSFNVPPQRHSVSSTSESAVSAEGFESASEGDLSHPLPPPIPNPLKQNPPSSPRSKPGQAGRPTAYTPVTPTHSRPHTANSRTHSFKRDSNDLHPQPSPKSPSRGTLRPSTSSSSATEDPTANAMALRGEVVPPTVIGDSADQEVPPVPPLPASVALQKNKGVENSLAFRPNNNAPPLPPANAVAKPTSSGKETAPHVGDNLRVGPNDVDDRKRDDSENDSHKGSSHGHGLLEAHLLRTYPTFNILAIDIVRKEPQYLPPERIRVLQNGTPTASVDEEILQAETWMFIYPRDLGLLGWYVRRYTHERKGKVKIVVCICPRMDLEEVERGMHGEWKGMGEWREVLDEEENGLKGYEALVVWRRGNVGSN
ncbi:MAG: hypothetical protein Q9166_007025 [cf. Caloplaca sp. 2 TL-2023]